MKLMQRYADRNAGRSEKRTRILKSEDRLLLASLFGLAAALAVGLADPAHAAEGGAGQLRRLDIMLMVTGLRCRTTVDDFQADYGDFTTRHIAELNEAARTLQSELSQVSEGKSDGRALDRMSVVMANEYGAGHPWASCGELRQVTQELARTPGKAALVAAATRLFGPKPTVLAVK